MAGEKVVAELERHAAALRELRRALEHLAARTDERFRQQGQDIQALQDAVAGLAGRVAGGRGDAHGAHRAVGGTEG